MHHFQLVKKFQPDFKQNMTYSKITEFFFYLKTIFLTQNEYWHKNSLSKYKSRYKKNSKNIQWRRRALKTRPNKASSSFAPPSKTTKWIKKKVETDLSTANINLRRYKRFDFSALCAIRVDFSASPYTPTATLFHTFSGVFLGFFQRTTDVFHPTTPPVLPWKKMDENDAKGE